MRFSVLQLGFVKQSQNLEDKLWYSIPIMDSLKTEWIMKTICPSCNGSVDYTRIK